MQASDKLTVAYGGFRARLVAFIIDAVIFGVFNAALGILVELTIGPVPSADSLLSPSAPFLAYTALAGLFWAGYLVLLPPKLGGTPGKLALGLRIVDKDHRYIGYPRAIGRAVAGLLSALVLFSGYIAIGLSEQKRGWHDQLAGTYVVKKEFALPRPIGNKGLAVGLVGVLLLAGLQVGATSLTVSALGQNLKPVVAVGDGFMGALQSEDYEDAFALCHPDLQTEFKSADNLRAVFSSGAAGSPIERWTFTSVESSRLSTGHTRADLVGTLELSDKQTKNLLLILLDEGAGWKLAGLRID